MKKAYNRFWDWLFHPSVRWYKAPRGLEKAHTYRYPVPGSQIKDQQIMDYRQPYENSPYNVRYVHPTRAQTIPSESHYFRDPLGQTVEQKLVLLKFLKQEEVNNPQALQKAKDQYKKRYGYPVQQKVYVNDFGINIPQDITNRQAIQNAIENDFYEKGKFQFLNMANQRKDTIDEPYQQELQSLDMYASAYFQQSRIENEYMMQDIIRERANDGHVKRRKGQANFWKALDDSNSPQNIKKVQQKIGDANPLDYKLRDTESTYQKDENGNIVDVHPK